MLFFGFYETCNQLLLTVIQKKKKDYTTRFAFICNIDFII